MPKKFHPAVELPGFFYTKDGIHVSIAPFMYNFLFGTTQSRRDASIEELRHRASQRLEALFRTCIEQQPVYAATSGGSVYWNTVAVLTPHVAQNFDPSGEEVMGTVKKWVEARRSWSGKLTKTTLTDIVDEFIKMDLGEDRDVQPTATEVAAATTQTAVAPSCPSKQPDEDAEMRSVPDWWLSDYLEPDRPLMTREVILRALGHATSDNDGEWKGPKIPTKVSNATEINEFLGYVRATTNTTQKRAFYAGTVAYLGRRTRQEMQKPSAGMASSFATLRSFLNEARFHIMSEGTIYTGLFTPWFGRAFELQANMDQGPWLTNPCTARHGMALALCPFNRVMQIVLFDPHHNYQHGSVLPSQANRLAWFRRSLILRTAKMAQDYLPLWEQEIWWGGRLLVSCEKEADSVTLSALFLVEFMLGEDGLPPWPEILEHDTEEERQQKWMALGYVRLNESGNSY